LDFTPCREKFIARKGKITNACFIPIRKFEDEEEYERNGHVWEGSVKIKFEKIVSAKD